MAHSLLYARAFLIAILLIAFQVTPAIAADSPDSPQITNFLKVGMTSAQIAKVISEKRRGTWWDDIATLGIDVGAAQRYPLGNGACLTLKPTGSPLKIVEQAFSSPLWKRIHPEGDGGSRYYLREQSLHCVSDRLEKTDISGIDTNCVSEKSATRIWRSFLDAPALQNALWDEKEQRFISTKR